MGVLLRVFLLLLGILLGLSIRFYIDDDSLAFLHRTSTMLSLGLAGVPPDVFFVEPTCEFFPIMHVFY